MKNSIKHFILALFFSMICGCISTPHRSVNPVVGIEKHITTVEVLQKTAQIKMPSQVALLLPLQGSFGDMGKAVRDGFMTAFYSAGNASLKMPTIKIYDTSQTADIQKLYNQAVEEGAQFVVGPLTKGNVNRLAGANIVVPTIALNYLTDDINSPANLIQFGLSTEEATKQVADHVWAKKIHRVLVITSAGPWGDRMQQSFVNRFSLLGGDVVSAGSVDSQENLNAKVQGLLNIDQSEQRATALSALLNEKLITISRRRQDVDGIFIAMNSSLARQVYPLLRFYYAGNLPVFSISAINDGSDDTSADQDLNGIEFNDIPWLFHNSPLRSKIQLLWRKNYQQNSRLYALGIDAYQLMTLFDHLRTVPNFAVQGVSGVLFLNDKRQIQPQLVFAAFKNGKAALLWKK